MGVVQHVALTTFTFMQKLQLDQGAILQTVVQAV